MDFNLYDTSGNLIGTLQEDDGCLGSAFLLGIAPIALIAAPFVAIGMTVLFVVGIARAVGLSIIAAESHVSIDPSDYLSVDQTLTVGVAFYAAFFGLVALVISRKWITRRFWLVVGGLLLVGGTFMTITQSADLRDEYRRAYCAQPPSATFEGPDPSFDCADYTGG